MSVSIADVAWSSWRRILPAQFAKFFVKGWGKHQELARLIEFNQVANNPKIFKHLVEDDYPVKINKTVEMSDHIVKEGSFLSPFTKYLPGIMLPEIENARFQLCLPKEFASHSRPVCIHLAGTGDHYFDRRKRHMALPLLKHHGIASILLENPYYGYRMPSSQSLVNRSCLNYLSDLFVMGGALLLECVVLLHWCQRMGLGPLGLTGISMGGYMASKAAAVWPQPVVLVPCLSWSTAAPVFMKGQGVMGQAIPWGLLQVQYASQPRYKDHVNKLLHLNQAEIVNLLQKNVETICNVNGVLSEKDLSFTRASSNLNQNQVIHEKTHKIKIQRNHLAESSEYEKISQEALDFMEDLLNEFTYLGNMACPVDPSLITILTAKYDAYVPRGSVPSLHDLWPGSQIKYLDCGHVKGIAGKAEEFRLAIAEAFQRYESKYITNN